MRKGAEPTREELERHAQHIPEIRPDEVLAMLTLRQAGEDIQHFIMDYLMENYHLSENKFMVLIMLHKNPAGLPPSVIAKHVGITKASMTAMLQKLQQQRMVEMAASAADGRGKQVVLTVKGREYMDGILPGHYLRISRLMGRLTHDEQQELIRLMRKLLEEKD